MEKNIIIKIINTALKNVAYSMVGHLGLDLIIKSRLRFEKWFQVELLKELLIILENHKELVVKNEYPVSNKASKKGKTIDLVIFENSKKLASIELKVVPTNYEIVDFVKPGKAVTNSIEEMISDLNKGINDNYIYSFSIGLIFPFPIDPNHKNNSRDFIKQENKLKNVGELFTLECNLSKSYVSRFYILTNK